MRLDPLAFNRFLNHIGQRFSWRKAWMCPCVSPATNSPAPDCDHCHGKGYAWASPVAGNAGVPSASVQREFAKLGQWESGDMIITVPSDSPLFAMGERDRIEQLNGSDPFSINLRRGINDRLPWRAIRFTRVYWLVGGLPVEGSMPSQLADGSLVFASGGPPAGTTYSVTGEKVSEYFVFRDLPTDRPHHFGAALPRRVHLRRFDLFGR